MTACAAGQDKSPPIQSASKTDNNDPRTAVAKGEIVTELDKAIWHVFQAKNNDYWFGSHDRGAYRFWFCNTLHRYFVDLSDSAGPKFRKMDGLRDANDPKRELLRAIISSTLDSTGALWMATYGEGVWRYDGKSLTHYPVKDGDKTITLFSIHTDKQGVIWLGTQEAGAYKFNGKTFEKFRL